MKLTWFGGTALRIHIGGRILVCNPASASPEVNRAELVSGADRVFERGASSVVDPLKWQPRRPTAAIEETAPPDVLVHDVAPGSALVDAVGEPPLLLLEGPLSGAGRWRTEAAVVVFDPAWAREAVAVLSPRLLVLAFDGAALDAAVEDLRDRLDGTSLVALELGMALEV